MPKFTVEPGRNIYIDGEPYISIGKEGTTYPAFADYATYLIADMLNGEFGDLSKERFLEDVEEYTRKYYVRR